jgi:hypothetical protein
VAVVVGPAGENIWTDALGRIKVQFPWDRLGANDGHSSCWLRVSSPWAGNQLGGIHIPRIGQEVIVDFISGDPDLPICTGRVHNQANLPPWALPGQSALSGFRSRELTKSGGGNGAAGRSNHLLMDDTQGQIQAQLKSDHQSSSLSLGFITRVEDNAGRKEARGEGFELRTDGHGVLRAQDGLLITTEARPDAARHAKDMGETTARLNAACALQQGLADAAAAATAQEHGAGPGRCRQGTRGAGRRHRRQRRGEVPRPVPGTAAPHLVLASAAGIAATTSGSLHLQAGEHIAISSEGHASLSAGKRLLVSAKDGIRLFALKSGMNWIAGNGKVQIEAHKQQDRPDRQESGAHHQHDERDPHLARRSRSWSTAAAASRSGAARASCMAPRARGWSMRRATSSWGRPVPSDAANVQGLLAFRQQGGGRRRRRDLRWPPCKRPRTSHAPLAMERGAAGTARSPRGVAQAATGRRRRVSADRSLPGRRAEPPIDTHPRHPRAQRRRKWPTRSGLT